MSRTLTTAILLGALTLAGTGEVRATPASTTIIVIEDGVVRKITRDHFRSRVFRHSRFHSSFDRHGFDRHERFDRQRFDRHEGFDRRRVFSHRPHGKRDFRGKAFGTRVIVVPGFGRSLHRHLPAQPLIRNGSFARRSFHSRRHRW